VAPSESAVDRLAPYVSRLVVDWLADAQAPTHRTITGTCVFADVSGFTALTERLATVGKAGAEEMGELLNRIFDPLLTAAYDYGANLVKWGGDAVLLLFDGERHAERAARAAWEMQATMRRVGKLRTSRGIVRLGMSIGIHSGDFDFLLMGEQYRELIITGPAATATSAMERIAQAGQIMITLGTAELIPSGCVKGAPIVADPTSRYLGRLLTAPPDPERTPNRAPKRDDVDIGLAFCAPLRDHLLGGVVEYEHRHITVGFVQFLGSDDLRRHRGANGLAAAVRYVIDTVQQAASDNGVTVLSTDVCENGGKVILIAGAPTATGDEETRILSAVRRIVRPGGRLKLRAGITRGRVFAGDYGTPYRRVYSVTGDVVNLSARLMAKAEPGQILAMPDVLEHSRARYVSTPVEPFHVKGKAEPIHAVRVGDLMPDTVVPVVRRMPLIGRDNELATLLEAARLASGGRGQVVELVGPAGIGKSRLLEELTDRTQMRLLWADGDAYGTASPYRPVTRLIRRTLGVSETSGQVAVARTISELTAGTAPDLLPWLSLIGVVAGVSLPQSPEVAVLEPSARKAQLEKVASDLFGRLLTMPTLFVINDLHYMDDASVDLIKRFCADATDRPWLVVISRRPDAESPLPEGSARSIALEPLSAQAARDYLLEATHDSPIGQHRLAQLIERAGGNPLFLRELTAGAHAGADLEDLPASIEGVIAARIDHLAPDLRSWLRSVSVLGMTIDRALLPGVLGDDSLVDSTHEELREFVAEDLDGNLRFAHHLVQQTAYEGLPFRRRRALHALAARELERTAGDRIDDLAAVLSLHSARGELYDSAWRYARRAGDIARRSYALTEAAECLERAVQAAQSLRHLPDAEVSEVCESLATVYLDLGELKEAEKALRLARAKARKDPVRLAALMLKTANHRETGGHYREALSWVSRGRNLLVGDQTQAAARLRAELSERYGHIRYRQGQYRDAIDWAELAIEEARSSGERAAEARAREIRSLAAATAGLPWDRANFDHSIALYDEMGDIRAKARAYNRMGAAAYYAGRWDDAVTYFDEAERNYRCVGREYDAILNAANRAEVRVDQGRGAEVVDVLRSAMQVWEAAGSLSFLAFGHFLLGRIATSEGDAAGAERELSVARTMSEELGELESIIAIDAARTQYLLTCARDPRAAEALASEALEQARKSGGDVPVIPQLQRLRALALVALGQTEAGESMLRTALASARSRNADHDTAAALADLLRMRLAKSRDEANMWFAELKPLVASLGLVAVDDFELGAD
jgi:class 3 adenylate cyclase/tetratricopeptide (TPR) repeat protein